MLLWQGMLTAFVRSDVYYVEDRVIELEEASAAPLPRIPLDVAVRAHWLAIEGVQPAIPENAVPAGPKKVQCHECC